MIIRNADIFPVEALTDTRGWMESHTAEWRDHRRAGSILRRRYGLLSGYPRYSVDRYPVWEELVVGPYPWLLDTVTDIVYTYHGCSEAERHVKLLEKVRKDHGEIADPVLRAYLSEIHMGAAYGAIIFSEEDAQWMWFLGVCSAYRDR